MQQRKNIVLACSDDRGLLGDLSAHFGRCPHYLVAHTKDGELCSIRVVANPHSSGHRPGQLPAFIKSLGADVIVAGGMGARAIAIFEQLDIEVVTGATGQAGSAVLAYLDGRLRGIVHCNHDHPQSCGRH